jgi:hypothetical protein
MLLLVEQGKGRKGHHETLSLAFAFSASRTARFRTKFERLPRLSEAMFDASPSSLPRALMEFAGRIRYQLNGEIGAPKLIFLNCEPAHTRPPKKRVFT